MEKDKSKKSDECRELSKKDQFPEKAIEENLHKPHRRADDMPGQLRGRGPQENMSIGYDALEDI